jgi:hypothetical protein
VRARVNRLRATLAFELVQLACWWQFTRFRPELGRLGLILREQAGTAGDVKLAYGASSNLTVTALNSLASSSTWLAGWQSDIIDNTSNLYSDYRITAKITVGSSAVAAGEIRMYVVGLLDDTPTMPDVFTAAGQATKTVTSAEIRDAICRQVAATANTTTASRVYYLECASVAFLLGGIPKKFLVFITHSSSAALASSGNQITVTGTFSTIAP